MSKKKNLKKNKSNKLPILVLAAAVIGAGLTYAAFAWERAGVLKDGAELLVSHEPHYEGAILAPFNSDGQLADLDEFYFKLYDSGQLYCNYYPIDNKNAKNTLKRSEYKTAQLPDSELKSFLDSLYQVSGEISSDSYSLVSDDEVLRIYKKGEVIPGQTSAESKQRKSVFSKSTVKLRDLCKKAKNDTSPNSQLVLTISRTFKEEASAAVSATLPAKVLSELPKESEGLKTFVFEQKELEQFMKDLGSKTNAIVRYRNYNYAVSITPKQPELKEYNEAHIENELENKNLNDQGSGGGSGRSLDEAPNEHKIVPIHFIPRGEDPKLSNSQITGYFNTVRNWYNQSKRVGKWYDVDPIITVDGNQTMSSYNKNKFGEYVDWSTIGKKIQSELISKGYVTENTSYMAFVEGEWVKAGAGCGVNWSTVSDDPSISTDSSIYSHYDVYYSHGSIPVYKPKECKPKVQRWYTRVLAHELGHTFNMTDNPGLASIMDYSHVWDCSWDVNCNLTRTYVKILRNTNPFFYDIGTK